MAQKTYGEHLEEKHNFEDDPESFVIVKQTSFGAEIRRSKLLSQGKMSWKEGGQEFSQENQVSRAELTALELYLSFVESNLQGPNGQLFKAGMNEVKFDRALRELPNRIIQEWHDFAIQVNPDWAPGGKREEG